MGLYVHNPHPNGFVRTMRHVYNPIGFQKVYNFILSFIFAGAMLGFCLARLEYFSLDGIFKNGSAPGEFFYYSRTFYKVGIALHLYTIIPAGMLAILQFVPAIRHKALIVHRINGYVALLLLCCGVAGALMITRYAFGGTMATQAFVGLLAIMTIVSAVLAYTNIKRLQIDQHRAWMLRTWFYAGSIITLRIIVIIAALGITQIGGYFIFMPCQKIEYMDGDTQSYAACRENPDAQTAVLANFNTTNGVEHIAAALDTCFGMAGFLALAMHAIGIEIYLKLTPAEGERLRQVSFERQVERGLSHPGSSGITVDRLGDAEPWQPRVCEKERAKSDGESSRP